MKIFKILLMGCLLFGCAQKEEEVTFGTSKFEGEYKNTIKFVGVGDNLIHETVYLDAKDGNTYDFSKMYEDVEDLIKASDIAYINQETPLGGKELGLKGYPLFNGPTEMVKDLYEAGFNVVNLASNHSMDRGLKALKNQFEALDEYHMIYDGVYNSQEEYDTIKTFEIDGVTFSLLSYTYSTNGINSPYSYTVSYFNETQIRKDVAKAKEVSDFIIVSAHWGSENTIYPTSYQKKYAKLFADLGVDVVIGTHPHVLQPIEWVSGKDGNKTLVAYSLGNFMGGMLKVENSVTGMIQFDIVERRNEITIENVMFEPMMIHFEKDGPSVMDDRCNYKVMKLTDYNDELGRKHALYGYNGQTVTMSKIKKILTKVIDDEYLVNEWK